MSVIDDDNIIIPLDDDLDESDELPEFADLYSEVLGEAVGGRARPAYVEQFVGVIRSNPCSTANPGDYSDARYYVDRAIAKSSASLSATPDALPGVRQCLTATNLAEVAAGTHLLPAGTIVQVGVVYDRSSPARKVYLFNLAPLAAVVVAISGPAAGSGEYNGRVLAGASNATPSADLAMPAGMRTPGADDALVLNAEEDGQTGHRLRAGTYAVGAVIGRTAESMPREIVAVRGGVGATASPTTLGGTTGGSETADTAAWSRATNATPLNVYLLSRTVYNAAGDKTLYAFVRQLSFDARGLLLSASAETRITVDATESCP